MSKVKDTKASIKSQLEAIKKLNDDAGNKLTSTKDKYLNDLSNTEKLYGKKLDGFLEKRKKKNENKKNIFEDLTETLDILLASNRKVSGSEKFQSKQRLKNHVLSAAKVVLLQSKDIVLNNVNKAFFSGDGICGTDNVLTGNTMTISPKEFDFLNILTIDPSTGVGKIVYESTSTDKNKQKVNRKLYEAFGGTQFVFETNNNKTLFTIDWDSGNQEFQFSGLTDNNTNVGDFFRDYYSSIELPEINSVVQNAMLMTLQGDGSESLQFNIGLNNLNRLLNKLLAVCGTPTKSGELKNQNATDIFNENDEDTEYYFDFDDTEGVDLEEEDSRYRKVLKFKDCNNFEIPVNTRVMKDFSYQATRKNINDLIDDTLDNAASHGYEQSKGENSVNNGLTLQDFQLSIMNNFILNLPKSLVSSVLSPKLFLPIIIIYRQFKIGVSAQSIEAKQMMKSLSKLFTKIIKDLFWLFIREFWKLIKVDLINFMKEMIQIIIKNKLKRYRIIITSLIALLKKLLVSKMDNCSDLFGIISNTINTALSGKGNINLPGFLLGFADQLPGASPDRMFLNAIQKMEANGIPTGAINGAPNKFTKSVKDTIDSIFEDMDANSFIKVSNKKIILPTPAGPIVIPPGILNSAGKMF